jgi:2-isopropylmalate synthase
MSLPLGKHSGRHAFAQVRADAGIMLTSEALNEAFARFKQMADARKHVTLHDVFEQVPAK